MAVSAAVAPISRRQICGISNNPETTITRSHGDSDNNKPYQLYR